jgi:cytoskeletal protein RodZ
MSSNDKKRDLRKALLTSTVVAAALVISGLSLAEIAVHNPQMAQATQPLQSTPGAESKPSAPAEPATTGTRPAELAPQPAHRDEQAQKEGATPALPPAPAEKIAPPIKERVHEK